MLFYRRTPRLYFSHSLMGAAWLLVVAATTGCNIERGSGAGTDSFEEDCPKSGCAEQVAPLSAPTNAALPRPANAQPCMTGADCVSGFCVDEVCCDVACIGTCYACTAAKKGQGPDGFCGPISSGGDPDNECTNGSCDGAGVCKRLNGVVCGLATECLSNYCVDGVCCGAGCTESCLACSASKKGSGIDGVCDYIAAGTDPDDECSGGGTCSGSGSCQNLGNGITCTANLQCLSGFCVDGVCCDSECNGTCSACSVTGGASQNGTCGFVAVDTDPIDECVDGSCNGAGACKGYNGAVCTASEYCGSGFCVDGFCCNNECSGTCQACSAAKTGDPNGACKTILVNTDPDNECIVGECDGTGVCERDIGNPCTVNAQCASGFCVDGFCCNTACNAGPCDACSVTGGASQDGTCTLFTGPACNDGNACTQLDTCQTGTCTGANPVTCTALDQCHVAGTCDAMTGICSNPNAPNGTSCTDSNACTQTDTCQTGMCTGANLVVCVPLDACHDAGTCDLITGICSTPPKSAGSACAPPSCTGSIRYGESQCKETLTCVAPSGVDCAPFNCVNGQCIDSCTNDQNCATGALCAATGKCSYNVDGDNILDVDDLCPTIANPPDQNGDQDSDGIGDACDCTSLPDGSACDDGNPCTLLNGTCQASVCVTKDTDVKNCNLTVECKVGFCDPSNGNCVGVPAADNTPCVGEAGGAPKAGVCLAGSCFVGVENSGTGGSGGVSGAGGMGTGGASTGGMGTGGTGGIDTGGMGGAGGVAGNGSTGAGANAPGARGTLTFRGDGFGCRVGNSQTGGGFWAMVCALLMARALGTKSSRNVTTRRSSV